MVNFRKRQVAGAFVDEFERQTGDTRDASFDSADAKVRLGLDRRDRPDLIVIAVPGTFASAHDAWFEPADLRIKDNLPAWAEGPRFVGLDQHLNNLRSALQLLRLRSDRGRSSGSREAFHLRLVDLPWKTDPQGGGLFKRFVRGGGDEHEETRLTAARQLRYWLDLCREHKVDVVVIGHSHGGNIAIESLRRRRWHLFPLPHYRAMSLPMPQLQAIVTVGSPLYRVRQGLMTAIFNRPLFPSYLTIAGSSALALLVVGLARGGLDELGQLEGLFVGASAAALGLSVLVSWLAARRLMGPWAFERKTRGRMPFVHLRSPNDEVPRLFSASIGAKLDEDLDGQERPRRVLLWPLERVRSLFAGVGAAGNDLMQRAAALILGVVTSLLVGGFLGVTLDATRSVAAGQVVLTRLAAALSGVSPELGTWIASLPQEEYVFSVEWLIAGAVLVAIGKVRSLINLVGGTMTAVRQVLFGHGRKKVRQTDVESHGDSPDAFDAVVHEVPEEVWHSVRALADASRSRLMTDIAKTLASSNNNQRLNVDDLQALIKKFFTEKGLVHTTYFRSRIFLIYLAKLVADASGERLTMARGEEGTIDDIARAALKADMNDAVRELTEPTDDSGIAQFDSAKPINVASWSGEMMRRRV